MFSSGHHPYLLNFILFHSISSVKTLNLNKIIKTNNLAIKIVFIIYHILNYKCSSLKEVKVNVMLKLISLFCVKYTIRESTIIECELKILCDMTNIFALEIRGSNLERTRGVEQRFNHCWTLLRAILVWSNKFEHIWIGVCSKRHSPISDWGKVRINGAKVVKL